MVDYDFANKTVLITGGSMGIGAGFARVLADRGARVLLAARSTERLEAVAREIGEAAVFVSDLCRAGAAQRLYEDVTRAGFEPDVLINNAGFGAHGAFRELPIEQQRQQIDLNVAALVELTYLFLPGIERRRGGVIQVASTAAFQPVPFMAVYGASKAFVLSFSEALWAEYRPRGVRVVALCPGATETAFFERAGEDAAFGKKARVENVVRVGLAAFGANRSSVVHGVGNALTAALPRFFSREFVAKVGHRLMRPKLAAPAPRALTR